MIQLTELSFVGLIQNVLLICLEATRNDCILPLVNTLFLADVCVLIQHSYMEEI